jgi:anthranilate synthase/aminodeoxychorismate synthase-like glutamine amidotransferase
MNVLVIDNYDSFVYNLVQYIGEYTQVEVVRNDLSWHVAEYARIVISPGPGHPREIPHVLNLIQNYGRKIPVLGVCLGHQAICSAFGGTIGRAERILHGKTSLIYHDGRGIYRDLPNPFTAARYHSLIATELPRRLSVTARSENGEIMGVRHKKYPIEGVQFHPESILTTEGKKIIENFLEVEK